MKLKYTIGAVGVVVIIVVVGVVMARHPSQNNSISNTPNAGNTANNTQEISQAGNNMPTSPIGKIGDTFIISRDSIKLRQASKVGDSA